MAPAALSKGVVTFLFTDIAGSTRLWERAPDAMALALERHDHVLRTILTQHGGVVFKTVGDAFCSSFEMPEAAVRAAIAAQRALSAEQWPEALGHVRTRIGVHTGEAVVGDNDYFGQTVNRVARLAAAGHGGQILLSAASAQAVRDGLGDQLHLRDMGAHRLKDLAQPERIFQVVADGLSTDFPALSTLDSHPNNLPSQISAFIGRDAELDELEVLLRDHRLVTIAGPGGIGKTRLGLQATADAIGRYTDGAWVVRLAGADDPQFIAQVVTSALAIQIAPGQSIEQTLVDFIAQKNMLLVFDNAEHVVQAAAELAQRLLHACPNLSILVSTREPLHVLGEHVLRIGPLVQAAATQLFIDRAAHIASDRIVASYDPKHVLSICNRLERIPLAIELAAARTATLGAKDLDERLQSSFDLLVSKDRSGVERHRTLASAIEWSYRLLTSEERRLFAILAAFEGSFSLGACEAVVAEERFETSALDLLDALVDKSFISTEARDGVLRFHLLEPMREFARMKLDELGAGPAIAERHFRYFKLLMDRWDTWKTQDEQKALLRELELEMPNVRAALDHGLNQAVKAEAFAFLQKAGRHWELHGHVAEARSWYNRALPDINSVDRQLGADVLRRAATLATLEDEYDEARDLTQRALEIFEAANDKKGIGESLHTLAVIEYYCSNVERAEQLYKSALDLFVETEHKLGTIASLLNLAMMAEDRDDLERADEYIERGIQLCSSGSDADKMSSFLLVKGMIAFKRGDFRQAERFYFEALAIKHELQSEFGEAEILSHLAMLRIAQADWTSALNYAGDALRAAVHADSTQLAIEAMELWAVVFHRTKRRPAALEILRATESERLRIHYMWRKEKNFEPELADLRSSIALSQNSLTAADRPFKETAEALLEHLGENT